MTNVINCINYQCKEIIKLHKDDYIQTLIELSSLYNETMSFYDDKINNIIIPASSNIRAETDKHIKNEYIKLKYLCAEEISGFIDDVIHNVNEQCK